MSPPILSTDPGQVPMVSPFAYPLDEFYALSGRVLPVIKPISGETMPEPEKSLLVHCDDMTPTLESFHGGLIHLRVIRRQQRGDSYFREVVLLLEGTDEAVEFGAIKINLILLPNTARRAILEERTPLGTILKEHAIEHTSRPKAYLRIEADDFISEALGLGPYPGPLFGRRNTLADPQQRPLAEIVEILPPARLSNAWKAREHQKQGS